MHEARCPAPPRVVPTVHHVSLPPTFPGKAAAAQVKGGGVGTVGVVNKCDPSAMLFAPVKGAYDMSRKISSFFAFAVPRPPPSTCTASFAALLPLAEWHMLTMCICVTRGCGCQTTIASCTMPFQAQGTDCAVTAVARSSDRTCCVCAHSVLPVLGGGSRSWQAAEACSPEGTQEISLGIKESELSDGPTRRCGSGHDT